VVKQYTSTIDIYTGIKASFSEVLANL